INSVVAGQTTTTRVLNTKRMRQSNLTLSMVDSNETHVTIEVSLTDAQTGEGINLERRDGVVRVMAGMTVNTSANGTARLTLRKPNDYIRAEYLPGRWWRHTRAYMSSSATMAVRNEFVSLSALITVAVRFIGLLIPFAFIAFFVDRLLGLEVWPPWRKI
ncbi:MAG: hypothetical protein SXQ77_03000, partial [Halobacteria archaeon]|nr:hypothetical protein [Halobacteria archaeon]